MSTIWKRYTTSPALPWNLDRAKHLHHRASFGATWSELQRDVSDGPETSINRLLDGTSRQRGQYAEVSETGHGPILTLRQHLSAEPRRFPCSCALSFALGYRIQLEFSPRSLNRSDRSLCKLID
jgi:hypothetical protein